MFSILQILTVVLVAIAMALALAHALELPGKMRLSQETYYAPCSLFIIQDSRLEGLVSQSASF
jgi:hypothetical protein